MSILIVILLVIIFIVLPVLYLKYLKAAVQTDSYNQRKVTIHLAWIGVPTIGSSVLLQPIYEFLNISKPMYLELLPWVGYILLLYTCNKIMGKESEVQSSKIFSFLKFNFIFGSNNTIVAEPNTINNGIHSNNQLKKLLENQEKQDGVLSELLNAVDTNPQYQQLIISMFQSEEIKGLSDIQILENAKNKIAEFKLYQQKVESTEIEEDYFLEYKILMKDGKLSEAENLIKDSIHKDTDKVSMKLIGLGNKEFHLSKIYYLQSKYQDSEIHIDLAIGYNPKIKHLENGAKVKSFLGKYTEALKYYTDAYTLNLIIENNDEAIADNINDIGYVYEKLGDYKLALSNYEKAQKMYLKLYGKDHSAYATSLNNIGHLANRIGDYETALKNYQEMLNIDLSLYQNNDLYIGRDYNNIAGVYYDLGKFNKANDLFLLALNICKNKLKRNHPELATIIMNIGLCQSGTGNKKQAIESYITAKNMYIKNFGENHPDVANVLGNLGSIYLSLGDTKKAKMCFTKSAQIFESTLGSNHQDTIDIRSILKEYD